MLVQEIAQYLSYEGFGTYSETGDSTIFLVSMPDSPDEAIMVTPTGGYVSDVKTPYDDVTLQIIVRGTTDPVPAMQRAQAIYDALHGFPQGVAAKSFVTDGALIIGCEGLQPSPVSMGTDENGRHEYSLNFHIHVNNPNRRA
jgi:hypothetical protein